MPLKKHTSIFVLRAFFSEVWNGKHLVNTSSPTSFRFIRYDKHTPYNQLKLLEALALSLHNKQNKTRSLVCVKMTRFWQSTPVLQSTPWPDEDLSLVGTETYGDTVSVPNTELSTTGVLQVHKCTSRSEGPEVVKSHQVHRYWYSSPWNPSHITWVLGGSWEGVPITHLLWKWESSTYRLKLHLRNSTVCSKRTSSRRWGDLEM